MWTKNSNKDNSFVVTMPFLSVSRKLSSIKKSIPKDSQQKKIIVKNMFEKKINGSQR